jgi:two-component system OmpR family sensor kinase
MNRSLQSRLSLMLALAILIGGVAASLVSFYFAYSEAQEFQDDALRQVASLSVGGDSETRRFNSVGRQMADPESRIQIIRLPQEPSPAWLTTGLKPGFQTVNDSSGPGFMRVFVRAVSDGGRIVVAQPTESRDEIARNSALRTLIPLLLLLPVLIALTASIVRGELASVRRLSERLDGQAADQTQALPEQHVPDEMIPFVQSINRLLVRVNRLVSEQRRFIADAAHELRTPLTALSLQVQNLERADTEETMRERTIPLKAGIERARHLTEQLLSLARTQAGTVPMESIEVSRVARELIVEYLPLAEAKDIDLGLDEQYSVSVPAAPEQLRLILKNALDNALRYTPAKGEVTVRLSRDRDDALIEVLDSGAGIPELERERVFDPFHRMAGTEGEGSGLGLAIARDAATRLGGAVSLHDRREGNGLIFRYRQPLSIKP